MSHHARNVPRTTLTIDEIIMNSNVLENRFKLEEPLAKGVSGGVFRAKDLQTGDSVAVKLLYTPPGADQNFGVRFKREADVLFELSHPHIVKIIHSGVTGDGVIYYAMEFINGVTLERYVNARGRITPHEAGEFLEQIASALDAVHARKIVHRDVTPSNIMIETDSMGRGRAKLIDFGFAKDLGMGSTAKGGPATGRLLLGVAAYMSPEVLSGKPATHLSDIHALGVATTVMLTGKHPFLRDAEVGTIAAVLEEAPPKLQALAPDTQFPAELEAIVAQTMAKRPSGRPQSAGEFARRFKAIVGESTNNVGESPSAILRRKKVESENAPASKSSDPSPSAIMRAGDSARLRAPDLSPSGRLLMHKSPSPASKPESSIHALPSVNISVGQARTTSWTVPLMGLVLVAGGVYALMNFMAS
jgi:serine/threonine protein kinase